MTADSLSPSPSADAAAARPEAVRTEPRSWRFEAVVLVLYTVLISVVSAFHEPWKDETQAWRLAIDSNGLRELAYNARYEGHPLLWHVLLQLVGVISRSWWAAAALHVVIACAAAWIVLRYAPFSRLQRVLLVFGYWSAYEYAVVVRPYGLGMALAFAACVAWTAARRRVGWAVVCLILLANTTAIGAMLAMVLALAFAVDWVWPDDPARRPQLRTVLAAGAVAAILAAGVLALAAKQIRPPADAAFTVEAKPAAAISNWDLALMPTYELRALTPVAVVNEGVEWSRWLLRPFSKPMLAVILVPSLVALAIGAVIASRRRVALVCYLVGTGGYLLFFGLFYPGTAHHHGYLFVVWVLGAWLARAGPASTHPRVLARVTERVERWRSPLFTASLVIPVIATAELSAGDLVLPFADSRHVGEVLRARGLADVPLIAIIRSDAQAVAALMDRPLIFPLEQKTGTFVVWGQGVPYRATRRAADSAVTALLARECRVVLIATAAGDVARSTALRSKMIYATVGRPMSGDRYRIWLATSPDSTRCADAAR